MSFDFETLKFLNETPKGESRTITFESISRTRDRRSLSIHQDGGASSTFNFTLKDHNAPGPNQEKLVENLTNLVLYGFQDFDSLMLGYIREWSLYLLDRVSHMKHGFQTLADMRDSEPYKGLKSFLDSSPDPRLTLHREVIKQILSFYEEAL